MMELHNQTTKKTDWTSYIFGVIAGIVPWIAIAVYLVGRATAKTAAPSCTRLCPSVRLLSTLRAST